MVVGIVPTYGWFYTGCDKCNTRMKDPVRCDNCKNTNTHQVKKYKVIIKVEDQTSNTTFLLWDNRVIDLVKVPVQHVLENDEVRLNCANELLSPYSISFYLNKTNIIFYYRKQIHQTYRQFSITLLVGDTNST